MNVTELFQRLSYGELSNLAIGGEGSGTIPDASKPKLISYLNTALLRLYSKFVLKETYLFLQSYENITHYNLSKKHAQTSAAVTGIVRYILDTTERPFMDDVIKVTSVHRENGCELALNDVNAEYSLFTPQPLVLQIPKPIATDMITVLYQARHVPIGSTDLTAVIDLPSVLEEALQLFMAHQIFFHMNGQDNGIKAAGYLKNYEMACQQVTDRDLVNSSVSTTENKFRQRGFV